MTSWLLVLALSASDAGVDPLDRRTRSLMHTEVTLTLPTSLPSVDRESAFREGFAVFEQIELELNEWNPSSALSAINAADAGTPVPASASVCEVVVAALDGARRTDGLFDPSWAALRGLWKFGSAEDGTIPPSAELQEACSKVNHRRVKVETLGDAGCTVTLLDPGMKLGLGGVVKGWGVDQVVQKFRARGFGDFSVQAGGDLYVAGQVQGRPWRVGIRDPRGPKHASFAKVELTDTAFSTSGDYEHFFIKNGVRYHHLIDPRTCQPARSSVSVTVLAKSALEAEFLTKAAFILGPQAGQPLVRRFGAAAVWVTPEGVVRASKGFDRQLEVWPPSGFGADAGP